MAQALGGSVRRHPAGWGLGLHRYEVEAGPAWLLDAKAVRLPASHQDQVVSLGPQGRVLASSAFTPFAMVEYPALKCLSLQPHPEFEPEFAAALIQDRRGGLYSEEQAAAALSSLAGPNDRVRVAGWLRAFMAGTR
jgi:GMP synthase-like glutamine amidotransferase